MNITSAIKDLCNSMIAPLEDQFPEDPPTLLVNRAQCPDCGDIVVSKHRHDYVSCKCGQMARDGGTDYIRGAGRQISMNLFDTDDHSEIRAWFYRGSRGEDGRQPLQWILLKDMTNEHLEATIEYNKAIGVYVAFYNVYVNEQEYRKNVQ